MAIALIETRDVASNGTQRQMLEQALIRQVLVGDTESFCELVRPYVRGIYIRAVSILCNHADAEEVVQESILKALRNLAQFRSKSKFSTWFIQIAINEARIKLRKDKRHLYESLECGRLNDGRGCEFGVAVKARETPHDFLERKELQHAVFRSLKTLPSKYRSVLELRELCELSTLDTAKTLGITKENVKTRLWRARTQMRDALAPLLIRHPGAGRSAAQTTSDLYRKCA